MTPSIKCADLIKGFEQCRLKAYIPTPNDILTIEWRPTGPDDRIGMQCNQAWAEDRLTRDLAAGAKVSALASNIGIKGFRGSALRRPYSERDYARAAAQFARRNKPVPTVLKGLAQQRGGEAHMHKDKR